MDTYKSCGYKDLCEPKKYEGMHMHGKTTGLMSYVGTSYYRACGALHARAHELLISKKGQGTTEYAILVGVLVVIAIVAITLFKPKIEELWTSIATEINNL